MTQTEINNGFAYFKAKVECLGILPPKIFMKYNGFIDVLQKDLGWSHKESNLFVYLLQINGLLKYDNTFLFLTTVGYTSVKEDESLILKISLKDYVYNQNQPILNIFYKLWDIIGSNRDDNPYYVDGEVFFITAKEFISGLPQTYGQFTRDLHENGESTTRIDWCQKLFQELSSDELPVFLDRLSEIINNSIEERQGQQFEENEIKEFDDQLITTDINEMITAKQPKIFISHNTADSEYAKAIVDMLMKLGIDETNDVFCSSLPGCGVPYGESFIDIIRQQYEAYELIVIFIHSPRYYNSHISLCEMGAAWIMHNEHRSFLTADCDFAMLDAVVPPDKTAIKAGQENTYHLLNDFKTFIEHKFSLSSKPFSRWEIIKNDFIKAITTKTEPHTK